MASLGGEYTKGVLELMYVFIVNSSLTKTSKVYRKKRTVSLINYDTEIIFIGRRKKVTHCQSPHTKLS